MTYLKGTFIGKWCVIKQSGMAYELSNGKKVVRVAIEDMEKGDFDKGELMFNLPHQKVSIKPAPKELKKAMAKMSEKAVAKKKTATKKKK